MKLIGVFSESHATLKDEWFLRTLKDDYDVLLHRSDAQGPGKYMEEDWSRTILFKSTTIIEAIRQNWGEAFVYSDVDVTFFAPTKAAIRKCLTGKDIVCQLDDPLGNLCTGFFGIRANAATLTLWEQVRDAVARERRDQMAFNRLVRASKGLKAGYLPPSFFGAGTFTGRHIDGEERFYVPAHPVMFHANWTIGVDRKVAVLSRAQSIAGRGEWRRVLNNLVFALKRGDQKPEVVEALIRQEQIASGPEWSAHMSDGGVRP